MTNLERFHDAIGGLPLADQNNMRAHLLGWLLNDADPDDVDAGIANGLELYGRKAVSA